MESRKVVATFILGETATTARANSWIDHVSTRPDEDFILYLAAGRLPFGKGTTLKERMWYGITESLTQMGYVMENHEKGRKGNQSITILLTKKPGWGTLEEILSLLYEIGFCKKTILVFSDENHLPRIEKIFKDLSPETTVVPIASKSTMDQSSVKNESKKENMAQLFCFIYKIFGYRALLKVSWIKNLILNVPAAKKEGHYYM